MKRFFLIAFFVFGSMPLYCMQKVRLNVGQVSVGVRAYSKQTNLKQFNDKMDELRMRGVFRKLHESDVAVFQAHSDLKNIDHIDTKHNSDYQRALLMLKDLKNQIFKLELTLKLVEKKSCLVDSKITESTEENKANMLHANKASGWSAVVQDNLDWLEHHTMSMDSWDYFNDDQIKLDKNLHEIYARSEELIIWLSILEEQNGKAARNKN